LQRENKILFILILGMMMGAIDTTIVLLALPAIVESLHGSLSLAIWVIVIYLLIVSVATTQLGRLGDLFGRSRLFNIGFLVFTVGSALCSFAPSLIFLIGSRAVQAIGGSMLEANSGAIVADTFSRDKRGKAYGFLGMSWTIGAMIGIVLGGILTTFAGWRFIFYINLPIGVIGLILGLIYLKDNEVVKESLDIPGMLLLGAALSLISYGLVDFTGSGLSTFNLSLIVIGIILIPIFLLWETRTSVPIIHVSTFKHGVLRSSILAAFFQSMGYLSIAFLMTLYLQGVRGLDPFVAAMLLLPGYIISSVLAPFMGGMADKYGARIIATIGIALMCITVLVYMTLGPTTPLYMVVFGSLFAGFGGAMFWPANNSAVMAYASSDRHGSTSGLLRTMSNVGTLGSYVLSITAASAFVSRATAFSIFLGTSHIMGGLPSSFLTGLDAAFAISLVILIVAGLFSLTRGKENRSASSWAASTPMPQVSIEEKRQ
jgi:EmrB/QacA subfamily drug resistance transporter